VAAVLPIVLPVLVGLALIGIANLVVRHGKEHRHNLFFATLYFLSGMKSVSEGVGVAADGFHASAPLFPPRLFWDLLGSFCALGMLPLLALFVSSFPRPMAWMVHHPRRGVVFLLPSVLVLAAYLLVLGGQADPAILNGIEQMFNVLLTATTVTAIVLLLRTRARSPDPVERTQSVYVLLGFLPAFVTGWVISGLQWGEASGSVSPGAADPIIAAILAYVSPLLELGACCLVAFAILKYNILGINPRFRLGVKSVLSGVMVVTLFLFMQFIENVVLQGKVFAFAGQYGAFILAGGTSVVLFKPIEKVSDNMSSRLLPAAAAVEAAHEAADRATQAPAAPAAAVLHAEQIYHAQATYVLRDAKVSDRELAFLANLRVQLGLSEAQARRIEETVERILKVDAPQTGHSAGAPAEPGGAAREPPT
jgi:hypothetical protein